MTTRALVLMLGLGVFLLAAGPASAATDPADACKDTKAKTTGKKASELLKAYGKNIKKFDPVKLGQSVSKAQSKMTKGFAKAESKAGCETTGDVGALEAKTDGFALSIVEDMGPTCGNGVKGGTEECDAGNGDGSGPSADCASGTCNAGCECAGCGDGILAGGEACDEGAANGTSASCCDITCNLVAASTVCDDTDGNDCTTAGCDGASGVCDQAHVLTPGGTGCGSAADTDCDNPDTCDGAGTCQPNLEAGGTACGSATDDDCTNPDTCDGAGTCDANDEAGGTACGSGADTECTDPDTCDGSGTCDANDAGSGSACGDTGVECLVNDTCDGAGSCTDNGFSAGGSACGSGADTECDNPDTCDGAGTCDVNNETGGAPCGTQGVECQVNDTCDGAGGCTDNGNDAGSTPCADTDGEACTAAGCDGAGSCDQSHVVSPDDSTPSGCDNVVGCSSDSCQAGVCTQASSCCTGNNGLLSFNTSVGAGTCGTLSNFRCSNNTNAACEDGTDCDFGTCIVGPSICTGNFSVMCPGGDGDCLGSCGEIIALNLPLALDCGGLYTGGGGNAVPLPFPVPDMGLSYTSVISCNSGTGDMVTGPTAPGDGGGIVTGRTCSTGRTCTGGANAGATCVLDGDCDSADCTTNCNFGPPLPIPNPGTPPTSVCTVNDVAIDASGTAECDGGAQDVSAPLRANVFLTGDLFQMTTPPDLPGVQPCPLCDTFCVGGTNDEFPCDDDSECDSANCANSTTCLGGPNDGLACTPATSDSATLGDTEGAFPTSHDCPPEPSTVITGSIGGLPIAFALTSGSSTVFGEDLGPGTGASRVFAGFCRDNFGGGSLCFEGNTSGGCPAAIPPAAGNAVSCSSDADCQVDTDEYESCAQRTSGAFSEAAATRAVVTGTTDGGCLGDGLTHTATLVSIFGVPPTFDSTVDAAGDLPGPGAAMIPGDTLLE